MTRDEKHGSGRDRPKKPRGPTKPCEEATAVAARQRIAKLMARVGLCSRRDAESWIVEGRVSVNGIVLTSPATDVGPADTILVDDAPLPAAEKTRLFLFHKPRGLVTSDHDPEGRATVADFLREHWPEGPRVVTIGRLDINTEGLLLLTNDGGLARVLELPRTGWLRRYRVRAKGETDQGVLDRLHEGISIDGVNYAGIEAKLDRIQGANCWLTMGLREGKNREIKRVLEHIGLEVNRLIRLSFGPFQLLDLPEGKVEEVRTRVLREQLGDSLAAAAGVDFDGADASEPRERNERPARHEGNAPSKVAGRYERRAADDPHNRSSDHRKTHAPTAAGRTERQALRADGVVRRAPSPSAETKPTERPVAGPRKHVSTLRADKTQRPLETPRKRTEYTTTKDRKDRTVTVERLLASRTIAPDPSRSRRGAGRFTAGESAEAQPRARNSRHASPSATAKRERVARSGGDTEASRRGGRARPPGEERDGAHRLARASTDAKPRQPRAPTQDDRAPNRSARSDSGDRRYDTHRQRSSERSPSRRTGREDVSSPPRTKGGFGGKARGRESASNTTKSKNEGRGAGRSGRPDDGSPKRVPRGRPRSGPSRDGSKGEPRGPRAPPGRPRAKR